MASRVYGDLENIRSADERFGKLAAWIVKSPNFKTLGGCEAKILMWACVRQDNTTHTVPAISPSDLSEIVGYNRNLVSQAVRELAMMGFVALKIEKRRFRIQVLFQNPDQHKDKEGEQNNVPLNASRKHLWPPTVARKKTLPSGQENMAQSATKNGAALGQAGVDLPYPPSWDQI